MSEKCSSTESRGLVADPMYVVSCATCSFYERVKGVDAALDVCDAHQEKQGEWHSPEFVRLDRVEAIADN